MASINMSLHLFVNKPNTITYTDQTYSFSRRFVKSSLVSSSSTNNNNNSNANTLCSAQLKPDLVDRSPMTTQRRSGNYKPPLWDFDYIQSLTSQYSGESYVRRASKLKMEVKKMVEDASMRPTDRLELIDNLQRLAISYHFEDEIKKILTSIFEQKYTTNVESSNGPPPPPTTTTLNNESSHEKDLYPTALEFRLLRQHGFRVPQDVFEHFKNEKGEFESDLSNDTKGLLQLYEASHLLVEGENTLEQARKFSTKLLQQNIYNMRNDENALRLSVRDALDMPLHWRVPRPNARWFIEAYGKREDKNTALLDLAKLEFNSVQAIHQEELKEVSRWWKKSCLAEILPFARDRLVENYFWAAGIFFDPRHGHARIAGTKIYSFINIIDDIYDIYGTLEELEHFTTAIRRWDIEAMDELPMYMQICFLALNNFVNDLAYDVLKEQGSLLIPYLRKLWIHLCKAYLQEAKWYSQGYTPKLEEYMENAWISISVPAILSHSYFLLENPIKEEVVQSVFKYHNLIRWSSIILRLSNDLGTSPHEIERGDVKKSVQCYMNDACVSEMEAREQVKFMMHEAWKKMNEEQWVKDSPFSDAFIRSTVDIDRMSQYMYEHGDGQGIQNPKTQIKHRISSFLFEPIAL